MGAISNLLLGITIALLPLYTRLSKGDFSRTSKDNLCVLVFLVLLLILPEKKRKLPDIFKLGLVYGLSLLILNQYNPASVVVMLHTFYISIGLIFFVSFYQRHETDSEYLILNGMSVGCLIQCLIVFCNKLDFKVYFELIRLFNPTAISLDSGFPGIGSLGNPNLLSAYVALTAISLFRKKWWIFLLFPLIALAISGGLMGYFSFAAGTIYYLNHKFKIIHKSWFYILSSILMVALYFTGINGHDTKRILGWKRIFSEVDLSHFLIGKGPGWFFDHGAVLSVNEILVQEHNEFISIFNFFGIIGVALIAAIVFPLVFKKDKVEIFPSILFAAFINSYGHFTLHQSTTAIIVIVSAAICLAQKDAYV